MATNKHTNVQVTRDQSERLAKMARDGESKKGVIARLLDDYESDGTPESIDTDALADAVAERVDVDAGEPTDSQAIADAVVSQLDYAHIADSVAESVAGELKTELR